MRNNSFKKVTIFLWALGMPFHALANNVITEKQAVTMALSSNPSIAAMQSRSDAMSHVPSQMGTLSDPVLSLNALNLPTDSFSTTAENMTQLQVGLTQKIPFPGKLGLREQAAKYESDSARSDSDEMRLTIVRNARLNWWNLFYLDRALSVVQRNQSLLRKFVKIAETKYKTGQGLQSDVLLAQVELSKLLEIEIGLKASRESQESQLNALLNRPADSDIELPTDVDETLPQIPDNKLLHAQAVESRPLLAAQRSMVSASDSRIALAEKDYYPDFSLTGAYGSRRGINPASGLARPDFASIGLSMTLPFYAGSKQDEALDQRKAEKAKEQFKLTDIMRAVDAEISTAAAHYRANYDQASLFKTGIIPQSSQTVSSMLASYQVNKVDFLNLVRAQITLYNYETQYWKAISSSWQAWARLEAAVGKKITKEIGKELIHE